MNIATLKRELSDIRKQVESRNPEKDEKQNLRNVNPLDLAVISKLRAIAKDAPRG